MLTLHQTGNKLVRLTIWFATDSESKYAKLAEELRTDCACMKKDEKIIVLRLNSG